MLRGGRTVGDDGDSKGGFHIHKNATTMADAVIVERVVVRKRNFGVRDVIRKPSFNYTDCARG